MKTQSLAAIVATIALGVASASAQNTTAGADAQANPAQTQLAPTHPQQAAQAAPTNGITTSPPAPAQQDTNPTATSTSTSNAQPPGKNAEIGTATINPTGIAPSQRNPLLADNGEVRVSKLIGSTIYNKDDQKVGTVDDVLAGQNGQLEVVVSTSNKKTVVPWDRLVFGDAKLNADNTVLMPDATRDQLDKMQAFNYQNNNKK